jgi:hypothetical protein
MTIRRYLWTVAVSWYDPRLGCKRELEFHYSVARSGPIRENRRKLGLRGAKYYQLMLLVKYGKYVPRGSIKVQYEREQPASKVERRISVEGRSMEYKGRHWTATPLPSTKIPLWASKNERVFESMRKDAEEREAHRKRIRALMDRWMKDASK